jgi:UDP-N-acetylglucosamine acyltransferase
VTARPVRRCEAPEGVVVHETAVVDPSAELAPGVSVGPLSYVGAGVRVGEGTEIVAQATLLGPAVIGRNNRIFPHAVLGAPPQDRSYAGEPTELVVGDDNVFRESVTVHGGTARGSGATRIGNGSLFMVGTHVAHDCVVGDFVTLANNTSLGGHVRVGDRVVTGGHVAVAQYCVVAELAFAAGGAMIERDVPPFVIVAGDRARVRGINDVGLARAGVPEPSRKVLARAYRMLWASKVPIAVAARAVEAELAHDPYVARLLKFLLARSERS